MSGFRFFDLNDAQQQAAKHTGGPLLILAGAGTGKTRVLTARIAWLVAQGADPGRILAVTFTNKAAREMRERVAGTVDPDAAEAVTACTFHSLCVRVLRRDAELLGYKANFSIFDDGDQTGLIKKIITRTAAADEKLEPGVAKAMISKAKNHGWGPPTDDDTLVGTVYRRYQEELRALNAMDFDDLLVNAVRVLADHPEARAAWRTRYRHMLVDEFQDTNKLQLELVSLLAAGDPPDVCVVGDDDQSIYGWRGAEVSNILEFEQHFPNPRIVKLEQNYRSTNEILEAANRSIANNEKRRGKRLWSPRSGGEPVQVIAVPDDREEAEFVVSEIAARRDSEGGKWEDFAILYRMNMQSRPFEAQLRERGIPYRLIGGKSFYDRREVKDVLSYMTCLLNPQNDAALLRIINTPPRGIGATTVDMAHERSIKNRRSLMDELQCPDFLSYVSTRASNAIREFTDTLAAARIRVETPGVDAAHLLNEMLNECGYFDDLRRSCKTETEADNRQNHVREFIESLSEFQKKKAGRGLAEFLDAVSLDREKEEKDDSGAGVTLITMHAAKGLEFSHVSLVGAEDGLLPHSRSKEEGTLDEERRLFYVAMTRAMNTLMITHCRNRMRYGSPMYCEPSPFLDEIEGVGVERRSFEEIVNQPLTDDEAGDSFARLKDFLAG